MSLSVSFICQYCERKFTMKHHLKRHIDEKRCNILKLNNGGSQSTLIDDVKSLRKDIEDLKNMNKNILHDTENDDDTKINDDVVISVDNHVNVIKEQTQLINNNIIDIDVRSLTINENITISDEKRLTTNINDIVSDVQSPTISENIINDEKPLITSNNMMSDEQIFKFVDEEAGYKFSEEHPMDGVSYESDRKKYDCVINGKHNRSIDVHKLCELKRINILGKSGISVAEIYQVCKKIINYQNKNIISFWTKIKDEIDPLFDINHILKLMNISDRNERRIKQKIENTNKFIYFEPNEYHGYIVRELIDEKTMHQIVLDSRSAFSKSFKSDVSDILINLRKSGKIQLVNTNLSQQRKGIIPHSNLSEIFSKEIIQVVNGGMKTTCDDNMMYIKDLVKKGELIHLSSYINDHVLYFFITNIESEKDHVICKIGYTSNISKRIHTLENEYVGTQFHLIGLKKIRNVSDEENFHSTLKHRYSQLIYNNITINKSHKNELYIFDKCLWEEFTLLPEFHNVDRMMLITEIVHEYTNGKMNEEMMKLILNTINNQIELEKMQCDVNLSEKIRSLERLVL